MLPTMLSSRLRYDVITQVSLLSGWPLLVDLVGCANEQDQGCGCPADTIQAPGFPKLSRCMMGRNGG